MKNSINKTVHFLLDEDGPAPIEYAMAMLLILLGGLAILNALSK